MGSYSPVLPTTSPARTRVRQRASTHAFVLLALLCIGPMAMQVGAERDFNFNDSQVPLLEPKDEPAYKQDPYDAELSQCQHGAQDIVLSLILKKHDWREMNDVKRAKVLAKLGKFFAIPKDYFVMDSVGKCELNEMQKNAIRRGAMPQVDAKTHLGRVSFVVGCGAGYFNIGEPIVMQIGHQLKDGSIDHITGEQFDSWFVWRKQAKTSPPRRRRQAEGSGGDDDDYDYEDVYDDTVETATEMPTVPTHAHRHHHGVTGDDAVNGSSISPPLETNDSTANRSRMLSTTTTKYDGALAAGTSTTRTDTLATSSMAMSTPSASSAAAAESTTSAYSSTDYVEPREENSPPMIKTRLKKLAVTSGKAFKSAVPEGTFFDTEDATNLRLKLTDQNGDDLKLNSWLQFNSATHELYGLPVDDTVSRWFYRLSATDSGNETVTETVEISVQQHRAVRTVNHEITIAVRIHEKHIPNIDWELKLIEAIATMLGDQSIGAVVVSEIRQVPQDPHAATLVYFNETLPTSECPETELHNLVKRLDAGRLSELVEPTLSVKSVNGQLVGSCQKVDNTKTTTHVTKNSPPITRNQIDHVNATVGHLLVLKVPMDTFYDPNGDELQLTVTLKTKDHKDLNPRHWLQFDSKNREFYGVPKSGDIGSEEYLLVAEDEGGLTATDALVVGVSHAPKKEFSVFFKAYLALRHENFNADLQRKFVQSIAKLHGDPNTSQIQVRSITTPHDSDSTIVNFYNTSLHKSHNRCPEKEVAATRNVYLINDHTLRDRVKKELGPELNITNLMVIPFGSCYQQIDITQREYIPTKPEEPSLKSTFSEEYLATFVLPAVIIVVMILIASIIACCLHRRRHKSGKMELGDEEERKSFRAKAPVIFQDELDEKPEIGNKSPIILKDEKPPLLPPSYNTLNMNGDNDVDEYVPPPAVVVGGREARGKSPATPSYRKPPPYVSP